MLRTALFSSTTTSLKTHYLTYNQFSFCYDLCRRQEILLGWEVFGWDTCSSLVPREKELKEGSVTPSACHFSPSTYHTHAHTHLLSRQEIQRQILAKDVFVSSQSGTQLSLALEIVETHTLRCFPTALQRKHIWDHRNPSSP